MATRGKRSNNKPTSRQVKSNPNAMRVSANKMVDAHNKFTKRTAK
ncbi:hypothetical protein ACLHWY_27150 [Priestia aryabhattai]